MTEVNKVAAQVMTGLGNGSGIDIFQLATDLTNVERLPKQRAIESAQAKTEAAISAYSVLAFQVNQLKTAFSALNDASELTTATGNSSKSAQIAITSTTGNAFSGTHELSVNQLAVSQRNVSDSYSDALMSLNGGSGFNLTLTTGSPPNQATQTIAIEPGEDTPAGLVYAINSSGLGYSASIVDTEGDGSSYRIILEGPTGEANAFTLSSDIGTDFGFHHPSNASMSRSAQDAEFTINGVDISRSSNTIDDVLTGVTFQLKGLVDPTDPATLTVTKDISLLKTQLQSMVEAYNSITYTRNELRNPGSTEPDVGGALSNDRTLLRTVGEAVRAAVQGDSSTPSGSITSLRDIGITIDRFGNLQFDEAVYDAAAQANFDDISTMLSAGTSSQSFFDGQPQGLARDVMASLEALTKSDGVINTRKLNAEESMADYDTELELLERRMDQVLERYTQQFGVMESIVSSLNSTRTYLEGQLKALSANLSNK